MSLRHQYLATFSLAFALTVAGCSDDSTAPSDQNFDADMASQGLLVVDAAFETEAFRAFAGLGANFAIPGALPASSAALLRAPGQLDEPDLSVRMNQAARQIVDALTAAAVVLIPDQFRGLTLIYVPGEGYVVDETRTDAPAAGIRFILYAVDPLTEAPVEPLNEIGFADVIDESTDTEAKVRLVVVSQGITFINYTVGALGPPTSPTLTIAGFVTDGTERADFTLTNALQITFAGLVADIDYDIVASGISISLALDISQSEAGSSVVVDLSFTAGGNTVTISGATEDESGTLEVRGNGTLLATITLSPTGVTVVNGNGDPLSADEIRVLEDIMQFMGDVFDTFDDLFDPVKFLFNFDI